MAVNTETALKTVASDISFFKQKRTKDLELETFRAVKQRKHEPLIYSANLNRHMYVSKDMGNLFSINPLALYDEMSVETIFGQILSSVVLN